MEHQRQQEEMKDSGWRFDKINLMTIYFHQTGIMNGSIFIKLPLRSNAVLNFENIDNYCFNWSILASLYPCNLNHPNKVSNYKQYFDEMNFQVFDFINGFKCIDVHKFNEINNLSINIFELNFHQDHNKWKHKLLPVEVSINESDRVIDFLIYKNHYVLIEKLHMFLGNHNCNYICRCCLNSHASQNVLIKHKQQCGAQDITSLRLSNESHLCWKKHFHKNPLYFRIYADFEADNEIDISSIGKKTTNICKQILKLNGYQIKSELENVLKSDFYKSPSACSNVDWFVNQVISLQKKLFAVLKN